MPEKRLKMLMLIKSQQMITKVSKNIQRAKSYSHVGLLKLFTVLYLLQSSCAQNQEYKDKETSKSKKNEKNT